MLALYDCIGSFPPGLINTVVLSVFDLMSDYFLCKHLRGHYLLGLVTVHWVIFLLNLFWCFFTQGEATKFIFTQYNIYLLKLLGMYEETGVLWQTYHNADIIFHCELYIN